jgi:hypothetical protein
LWPRATATIVPLFDAIAQRVTTRETFVNELVPPEFQRRLVEADAAEGCDIACVETAVGR